MNARIWHMLLTISKTITVDSTESKDEGCLMKQVWIHHDVHKVKTLSMMLLKQSQA